MTYETPPTTPEPASPQQPFDDADGTTQGRSVRVALPQAAPYVTYAIIGITAFVYVLQLATQFLIQVDLPVVFFIKVNDWIREGQLWRLFTPALVHGSITHIGFNMYALLSFGTGLERHFGHGRFLALYVLGAFAGNVMSFLFVSNNSLGASTAVFGLLGAEGIFLYQNRKLFAGQFRSAIGNIIFIAAINLFVIGSLPNIDNAGHVGGLMGGLMFAWFASPLWAIEGIQPMLYLVDRRSTREVVTGAALVLIVFGALAVWGMVR